MIFIKILVPFVTLLAMAHSDVGRSLFTYFLFPYDNMEIIHGWRFFCPRNATDQKAYESILDEARNCYKNLTIGNQSICHNLKDRAQKCSQPLVDFFVDCFPEKAKDLPPAIFKGVTSFVEALCTSPADLLLEVLNPCIYEFAHEPNKKTLKEECKATYWEPKFIKFEHELPSKIEACKVYQELGDCWQYYVNLDCGGLATKDFFSKLYNATLAGCK